MESEAAYIKRLAAIYATTFPLAEGAAVHRMNDRRRRRSPLTCLGRGSLQERLDKNIGWPSLTGRLKKRPSSWQAGDAVNPASVRASRRQWLRQLVGQVAKLQAFAAARSILTS